MIYWSPLVESLWVKQTTAHLNPSEQSTHKEERVMKRRKRERERERERAVCVCRENDHSFNLQRYQFQLSPLAETRRQEDMRRTRGRACLQDPTLTNHQSEAPCNRSTLITSQKPEESPFGLKLNLTNTMTNRWSVKMLPRNSVFREPFEQTERFHH